MKNHLESKNSHSNLVIRDILLILASTTIVGIIFTRFDLFEKTIHHFYLYEAYELDDLFLTALFLAFCLILFSYHLYRIAKKESLKLIDLNLKFNQMFDYSNDSIFVFRSDGSILDVNLTAANKLGYSKKELMKMLPNELFDIDSFEDHLFASNNAQTEKGSIFELSAVRKNGSKIMMEASTRSFVQHDSDKGNVTIGIFRDLSSRKRAQEAVHAKREAEELNRITSDFLANMSHELRTPLNSIIGFSQLLGDKKFGSLSARDSKYISNILKSGEHLLNLINNILDLSKVEAGKMDFNPETTDIDGIVNDTMLMIRPLADKKYINILVDAQSEHIKSYVDPVKMKEILYNLLSNAIKFTPANGDVIIDIKQSKSLLQISVSDSGIGISESDKEKVFDPFKQIESSNNRKFAGTGLGLALVKQYVEMHDGDIWVESEIGKGSKFTFTIPIKQSTQ